MPGRRDVFKKVHDVSQFAIFGLKVIFAYVAQDFL